MIFTKQLPGSKEQFVFVHGNAQNHKTFGSLATKLNQSNHKTLQFDLPGHGDSKPYEDGYYSMEKLSQTLRDQIEKSNVKNPILKPILVGHSMGGMISLQYAIESPDKIKALVLISTTDFDPIRNNKEIPLKDIVNKIIEDSYEKYEKQASIEFNKNLTEEQILENGLGVTDPRSLEGNFTASTNFDVRDKLNLLKFPILIIRGENDALMNAQMTQDMHKRLPNSKLITLVNCGHNFIIQDPDLIIKSIIENFNYLNI